MVERLTAAQRRFNENALLIAALGLIFQKLYENCESKQLGSLAETTSGGTPSRDIFTYYGGEIPWVKSGELNDGIISEVEEFITLDGLNNSSAKVFPKGTLVVALYGATVGKTGILGMDAATNQAVCAIFPKDKIILTEYLFWFFRYKRPEFLQSSFGGAQPNISQKTLRITDVPIPAIEIQIKVSNFLKVVEERQIGIRGIDYPSLPYGFEDVLPIVKRIEALATRVIEAQVLYKSVIEETELLFTATVSDIPFSEKQWTILDAALSKEKGAIHSGPFGSDLTHDEFVESGVAAVGTRDVQVNKFILNSGWYVTPERFERLKQYQIFPNDVLVTIIGGSIGRFCVVPEDAPLGFTTKHVIAMQFNPSLAEPRFMSYMLNFHRRCRKTIFSQTAGSAQPSLNISKIKAINIPLPPLYEQQKIIQYLDGLDAKIMQLKKLRVGAAQALDALLPSILDKAFKGEL